VTEWVEDTTVRPETPIATNDTAMRMRSLLRLAVESGVAADAAQAGLPIGGYATFVAEPVPVATFIGYVETDSQQGFAIAVILENGDDFATAARIGGDLLALAAQEAPVDSP
jgi:hypothetical protein